VFGKVEDDVQSEKWEVIFSAINSQKYFDLVKKGSEHSGSVMGSKTTSMFSGTMMHEIGWVAT